MKKEFTITSETKGQRLDLVLSSLMDDISRSKIQKLIEDGFVFVNGEKCTSKKYLVIDGDKIDVEFGESETLLESKTIELRGEAIDLDVVYEDDDCIVINKPKGLVVHPGNGNETGTLLNGLINYFGDDFIKEFEGVCDPERPGIVHRIDKDTTGLLVVAKSKTAFLDLSSQFKEHSITRKYTAIVFNSFREDEGTVNAPIGRDSRNRLRRAVNGIESRDAITHYKVLERMGNFNLIEAILETGRTHQIRVHMAYVGHPVLGDPVYGPRKSILGIKGQMLHAGVLGFKRISGEYVEFSVDLTEEFLHVLNRLRKMVG